MPRLKPRTKIISLLPIFLLAVLSLSCRAYDDRPGSGSSGLVKDPAIDLTGDWAGTWDTEAGFPLDSGTVNMTIDQDDLGALTGTSTWTWVGDEDCWTSSDMKSGVLEGTSVTKFVIVELLASNASGLGGVTVVANFTVNSDETGDEITGTFLVTTFTDSTTRCSPAITRLTNSGSISLRRL